MSEQAELAIVIPTYNRAAHVSENLRALLPQCAGQSVDIVVVDSGSSQEEARALQEMTAGTQARLVRVEEPGLSRARNAGVESTASEWIAFLDDDAIPYPNWLEATLARTRSSDGNVGAIGGQVIPRWPAAAQDGSVKTSDLGPRSLALLSVLLGDESYCTFDRPSAVGANMFMRRSAFDRVGGFPENQGAVGLSLHRGEDAWILEQIAAAGFVTWYDGAIKVDHVVHANRLNKSWLRKRFRSEGAVTIRRQQGTAQRWITALKCLASLPVLGGLSLRDAPEKEYEFRLHHNLGVLGELVRGR